MPIFVLLYSIVRYVNHWRCMIKPVANGTPSQLTTSDRITRESRRLFISSCTWGHLAKTKESHPGFFGFSPVLSLRFRGSSELQSTRINVESAKLGAQGGWYKLIILTGRRHSDLQRCYAVCWLRLGQSWRPLWCQNMQKNNDSTTTRFKYINNINLNISIHHWHEYEWKTPFKFREQWGRVGKQHVICQSIISIVMSVCCHGKCPLTASELSMKGSLSS